MSSPERRSWKIPVVPPPLPDDHRDSPHAPALPLDDLVRTVGERETLLRLAQAAVDLSAALGRRPTQRPDREQQALEAAVAEWRRGRRSSSRPDMTPPAGPGDAEEETTTWQDVVRRIEHRHPHLLDG